MDITSRQVPSSNDRRTTKRRNSKTEYPLKYKLSLRNSKFIYEPCYESDLYRTPLQRRLYYFFEDPQSKKAQAFACFSTLCVLATILIICLDSLPTFFIRKNVNVHVWLPFDILIVLTFTVEYFGKYFASQNKWKFVLMPYNIVNLVSIIPFFIQIFSPFSIETTLRLSRILRLTRIVNLLQHLGTFSEGFTIATNIFLVSMFKILVNSTYFIIVLLISASIVFYFERGEFDYSKNVWYRTLPDGTKEQSPFQSIFHSLYWSISTMTTTGYGDIITITFFGRITAALTALSGIIVIAITSAFIGTKSDQGWCEYYKYKTKMDFRDMWRMIDDKDDYIERNVKERTLEFQHSILLNLLEEIRREFDEINGIDYLKEHNDLAIKHSQTIEKLSKLEFEAKKYKSIFGDIECLEDDENLIDIKLKKKYNQY